MDVTATNPSFAQIKVKSEPGIARIGTTPSAVSTQLITAVQLAGSIGAKPQSATDQLLLAMQSAAANSSALRTPSSTALSTVAGTKGYQTGGSQASSQAVSSLPLGSQAQHQPQLLMSPALQGAQPILANQLSGAQQLLTIPSNGGQQQILTLPITNAAGQQQILTIPVTLAQGAGGIQFLIPTGTGGQFLASPNLANLGAMPSQVLPSTLAAIPSITSSTNVVSSAAHYAKTSQMTSATTPLPPVSVLTGQTGLGTLPLPQVLMGAGGQVLSVSAPSSSISHAHPKTISTTSVPSLVTTQNSQALPSLATVTQGLMRTSANHLSLSALGTTQSVHISHPSTTSNPTASLFASHKLSNASSATAQALSLHGLAGLNTAQGTVISHIAAAQGSQSSVAQILPSQLVRSSIASSQASQVGGVTQVPGGHQVVVSTTTATSGGGNHVTGGLASPVSNMGNAAEVDGINLEEIKEFAKAFKIRRLSLGLTQTQVGQALSQSEGPAYSQSAICRFEKLDITPKSAQKIKPVLERWMAEAEERHKNGLNQLTDFIGSEPVKKRKRRTSFTPQALEYLSRHFEKNTHPTGAEMTALAQELNYDREVIRVWFCNKRQALKNTIKKLKAADTTMNNNSEEIMERSTVVVESPEHV
ncbi:POU domain, class 6, transcription factor 1 isoform X2 [Strongylocentrotus purpuratus]|uniref:POU domain protein n=1 Tax=Strongylocentrotus purpuratus TaxID=7668 RepID=A0A7M7RBH5_STRPU|nr:POU domain, class 6, transcription factor 1 isoform X2 [Strongylocentrotus purpuratus]|eukprot:XP_785865.3 PREDICTED: POU domain, class 6, transcription factor 1 isoform X2 [Strongylocentrotus purpuratus]